MTETKSASAPAVVWQLKVEAVKNFGAYTQALFDTDVVRNSMSAELAKKLYLSPEETSRSIRATDGRTGIIENIKKSVSVSFLNQTTEMDLLAIDDKPVSKIIGTPTLEKLKATLNHGHIYVTLKKGKEKVQLYVYYEHIRKERLCSSDGNR